MHPRKTPLRRHSGVLCFLLLPTCTGKRLDIETLELKPCAYAVDRDIGGISSN
jgi:hypothetical protein